MALIQSRDVRDCFDQFWCEVGFGLETLHSRVDVPKVLALMKSCGGPLIELLLTELEPSTVKRIKAIVGPYDAQRIGQILQCAEFPPSSTTSEFAEKAATKLRKEQLIGPCKVFFAQEELANFCGQKSIQRRYVVSPYTLGCAMAGMPAVGWRTAMKICKAEDERKAAQLRKAAESPDATEDVRKATNDPPAAYMDGSKYTTIKIISSLIRYGDTRPTFWKTAERRTELVSERLKNSHLKTKVSVQLLKNHKSELMRALNLVHTHGIRGPERPYAIGREYFHLLEQRRTQKLTPESTGPVT